MRAGLSQSPPRTGGPFRRFPIARLPPRVVCSRLRSSLPKMFPSSWSSSARSWRGGHRGGTPPSMGGSRWPLWERAFWRGVCLLSPGSLGPRNRLGMGCTTRRVTSCYRSSPARLGSGSVVPSPRQRSALFASSRDCLRYYFSGCVASPTPAPDISAPRGSIRGSIPLRSCVSMSFTRSSSLATLGWP